MAFQTQPSQVVYVAVHDSAQAHASDMVPGAVTWHVRRSTAGAVRPSWVSTHILVRLFLPDTNLCLDALLKVVRWLKTHCVISVISQEVI